MTQTAQTQRRSGKRKHAFKHSTWITAAWEWFLELVGRAAEAILVISVLYASVKLLPVIHMPVWLDVMVFIAQFVALDVGGLSLGKLAKQAAEAGNEAGAKKASTLSFWLIAIMIAGVVVVALEGLFPIPGNWKLGIDTVLLIARSVLAVLYGAVIHSVKVDDQANLVPPAGDIATQIADAIAENSRMYEARIASLRHEIEAASEAKLRQFFASLEARFEAEMKQRVVVSEAKVRQQIDAPKAVSEAKSEAVMQRPVRQKTEPSRPANVVPMRQADSPTMERRNAVYRLADSDQELSSYDIAERTGIPSATVQRYLRERRELVGARQSEATGTVSDAKMMQE